MSAAEQYTNPHAGVRERMMGNIREDPSLAPEEKETYLHTTKDSDRLTAFSAEAGFCRRLVAHPASRIQHVVVDAGHGERPRVDPDDYDGQDVVGVKATLPVSALTIASDGGRQTDQHAEMISSRVLNVLGAPAGGAGVVGDD